MHLATTKEVAALLISNGADVNARLDGKDSLGWTSLHLAVDEGHTEIAELLRKHGGKMAKEMKVEEQ